MQTQNERRYQKLRAKHCLNYPKARLKQTAKDYRWD
jgi:hypothetical protein